MEFKDGRPKLKALSTDPQPFLSPDVAGEYDLQLVVSDGIHTSPPSTVSIFENDDPGTENAPIATVRRNLPPSAHPSNSTDQTQPTPIKFLAIVG
jgi:hypothetical protein